jgi:hypothetical protein
MLDDMSDVAMDLCLAPLRQQFAGERVGAYIGGVLFELIAMGMVLPLSAGFCVAINMEHSSVAPWFLVPLGAVLALVAAYFFRRGLLLRDPNRTPMLLKLLHDPEDVVWVHSGIAIDYRTAGETVRRTRHVVVLTESGENTSLEVNEHDAARILSALEGYLPHATIGGFSPERMARYREDPSSLRLESRREARGGEHGAGYRDAAVTTARRSAKTLPPPARAPFLAIAAVALALTAAAPPICDLLFPIDPHGGVQPVR